MTFEGNFRSDKIIVPFRLSHCYYYASSPWQLHQCREKEGRPALFWLCGSDDIPCHVEFVFVDLSMSRDSPIMSEFKSWIVSICLKRRFSSISIDVKCENGGINEDVCEPTMTLTYFDMVTRDVFV